MGEESIEGHEDFYKESEQQRLETSLRVKKPHLFLFGVELWIEKRCFSSLTAPSCHRIFISQDNFALWKRHTNKISPASNRK